MLAIQLPTILPIAMSGSPRIAATREVTSSGSEVPTATTVSPMTKPLRPRDVAMFTAPVTKQVGSPDEQGDTDHDEHDGHGDAKASGRLLVYGATRSVIPRVLMWVRVRDVTFLAFWPRQDGFSAAQDHDRGGVGQP